jgi:putative ABC transport system substrate-binding protein
MINVGIKQSVIKSLSLLPLTCMIFSVSEYANAQQSTKSPRIGYLGGTSPSANSARIESFRQGLREFGYAEGKTITIEWRHADAAKLDRLPALAAELVRLRVDLIITGGPPATRSAKEATATIPIVMAFDDDPVGNGFVTSLTRPGGNITGLSALSPEISGKRLEILNECIPRLSRIAIIGTSTRPGNTQTAKETELAAHAFGMKVFYFDVLDPMNIETAFRAAGGQRVQAILLLSSPVFTSHRSQIAELAVKARLPVMYPQEEFVHDGALMTYGASVAGMYHRAAAYVDKILKGAKPAELPVEQPRSFELVINLKGAKQIGLVIPPNVLARADRVIR